LPNKESFLDELGRSAIIRELHVYGQTLEIGAKGRSAAQHIGLGGRLIDKAKKVAKKENYDSLAVISAIGTRDYYRKNGFKDGKLYQHLNL
jgi:elongator complex protein 3